MSEPRPPALYVERMTVRADRLVCDIVVRPDIPRSTNSALAARVLVAYPHLPLHACVNDEGDVFGAVLDHTSLPHLLEHLVIDEQTRAASASARDVVYVGTTEWTDEFAGRARIEVSFTDDLVALRAFRHALDFLNATVVP